jgi:hypothetical protein
MSSETLEAFQQQRHFYPKADFAQGLHCVYPSLFHCLHNTFEAQKFPPSNVSASLTFLSSSGTSAFLFDEAFYRSARGGQNKGRRPENIL